MEGNAERIENEDWVEKCGGCTRVMQKQEGDQIRPGWKWLVGWNFQPSGWKRLWSNLAYTILNYVYLFICTHRCHSRFNWKPPSGSRPFLACVIPKLLFVKFIKTSFLFSKTGPAQKMTGELIGRKNEEAETKMKQMKMDIDSMKTKMGKMKAKMGKMKTKIEIAGKENEWKWFQRS